MFDPEKVLDILNTGLWLLSPAGYADCVYMTLEKFNLIAFARLRSELYKSDWRWRSPAELPG